MPNRSRKFLHRAPLLGAVLVLALALVPTLAPRAEAASRVVDVTAKVHYTSSGSARSVPLARLGSTARATKTVWESTGTRPVGSWVRWRAAKPTKVDRVRIVAAAKAKRMVTGVLRFSNGSKLTVHTNASGDLDVRFKARTVRWVKLTVTKVPPKHKKVALARLTVTRAKAASVSRTTTSSSASDPIVTPSAAALVDARSSLGRSTGQAWEAGSAGTQRITLTWPAPVELSTVQVYGSPVSSGAALSGELAFSDGSSVPMLPVAAGDAGPTTVAFTPRVVRRVTVALVPRAGDRLRLREVAAFSPGTLAPAAGGGAAVKTSSVAAPSCAGASSTTTAALRLVCPTTGSAIDGRAVVVVSGPESAKITATAVLASGDVAVLATGTVDRGRARLSFDAAALPGGPVVVRVLASGVKRPLYIQLVNHARGVNSAPTSSTAKGRTLVFDDEFSAPLSVSANGAGTKYAATKPASWGNSEFGDAVFANPATHPQNISTTDGRYLRIRTTPLASGEKDPNGWGRKSRGGIVSSASVPGGGFGAQYGYFEARMLAPASPGTWPAFWMMSSDFLKNSQTSANSEVDAVELYGQDSSYSCHSWHDWIGVASQQAGRADCVHALPDWALTWHTYGVDIARTGVKYYIDGKLVSTGPRLANASDPFYFMLDLSLGGGWPIDLSGVNGVTDLYVDYVRVYV